MEGIFGNLPSRKTLSSEITKYEIFMLQDVNSEDLDSWRIKCLALATSLTNGYVWHNEGFNLSVSKSGDVPCLLGATDFGDFTEDEWLVVWLLYEITKVFTNIAARIKDADGEFLLIEAADHLPKWLTVDTADNRVFIHGGQMHIIRQPQTPGEISKLPIGKPMLQTALESVRNHPGLTKAHKSVEECITKRISGFPKNLSVYVQKVNAYLPEDIARILDREPGLVSAAIRAFYYRDPIDLRACRVFKEFTPHSRVWTQISMNRCGYAQLMQQIFKADRRSGYSIPKDCGKDFKGIDMGCKIAHGFEILCSSCKNNTSNDSNVVFDELGFKQYVTALEKRGYFCGEMEGSKKHRELLSNARTYFVKFSTEGIENSYTSIAKSAGERILAAKRRLHEEFCESTSAMLIKNSRTMLPEEDGDEWMYLNDSKMDAMLSDMKHGFEKLGKAKLNQKSEEGDLNDLTQKMRTFISNLSDYEGVESFKDQADVSFDPLGFENALKRLCNIPGETDDSCSDDFLSSEDTDDEGSAINSDGGDILNVMEQMDSELALTNVGKSFVREDEDHHKTDAEEFTPVDIDLNMVQNFLRSCESETEIPGAASTLLHSIGLGTSNAES